jgi:hypothetical protein
MSVVAYEGGVATPRIVGLGGRRCVPGAAITLPIACCQASTRVRSPPIMALRNGSGAIKATQLLQVSSRANGRPVRLAVAHFFAHADRQRSDRVAQSPSRPNGRTRMPARHHRPRLRAARLARQGECRMALAAKNLFVSALTRWNAHGAGRQS